MKPGTESNFDINRIQDQIFILDISNPKAEKSTIIDSQTLAELEYTLFQRLTKEWNDYTED